MAGTAVRFIVLTDAPHGGAFGPIPTFAAAPDADAWATVNLWGIPFRVLAVSVFATRPTFVLVLGAPFGGARGCLATFDNVEDALRYGRRVGPLGAPRAVRVGALPPASMRL